MTGEREDEEVMQDGEQEVDDVHEVPLGLGYRSRVVAPETNLSTPAAISTCDRRAGCLKRPVL